MPSLPGARSTTSGGWPVTINDTSDNPGGGTPGDGTHLLRAFLEAGLQDSVFGGLYDPEVVDAAIRLTKPGADEAEPDQQQAADEIARAGAAAHV